ncbi:ribosomal S4p-like protein [Idiomarina aquatica]|uniref:Ribosomal S4p-like protein n=1 Tax=Idiomarina aquatica TaxID=1327752 RepID=A0A4R6PQV7_9GAMM|nr:VC2046/SO_2500 family protein [Idiomarina aquatica]TDP40481.1 ribosomal S4p-like protein [Idiomarina aquatica]
MPVNTSAAHTVESSAQAFFDHRASAAMAEGHGAEFALWLAAMGEQPINDDAPESINWTREIGAARARPLGYDQATVVASGVYNQANQLSDFKLQDAVHPQPLIANSDPQRLPLELIANLDWQTLQRRKRKQQPEALPKRRRDPAQLYDVLQQLGIEPNQQLM